MWTRTPLILISVLTVLTCMGAGAFDLEAHLRSAITNLNYRGPSASEFELARELFKRTLQCNTATPELKKDWARLGFELREVMRDGEVLLLLAEHGENVNGQGWYLFRTNQNAKTAIQAPHARNDVHTGVIGLRLFLAGPVRAYAASTITRHKADLAHLEQTYFQAFTLAFAEVCPTGLVVQLHGFDAERHKSIKGQIVASAGTNLPPPWLGRFTSKLARSTSLTVLAYPEDTPRLGGTTNAQANALRRHPQCRFLHLEMTRELRNRLVSDSRLHVTIVKTLLEFQTP